MRPYPRIAALAAATLLVVGLTGCATLRQVAALRNVDFVLDRLTDLELAGIDLERLRSYEDLGLSDGARLALAVSREELPLEMTVHLLAENPAANATEARLVEMDWTLLLEDRETVSGTFNDPTVLPPGEPTGIPVSVRVNLIDFFDGSGKDLFELALSLAADAGSPKNVALRVRPIIETPLGPIRYPRPITVVDREIGGG